ncbi:MAG: hypothetical protein JRF70_08535 [Deltaproteobacteria bacterium]|nr:hypothetical protein [Deltaproteobacteria bacterium]MBW2372568.1 hypothetical protein [Deltaproteobacteria bacterium]
MKRVGIVEVMRFLDADDGDWFTELRREGLFPEEELTPDQADDLRLAALLMRELGVNPAGVDVALHLRRRLLCLEERMRTVLRELVESGRGLDGDRTRR